jgi:hypothetical protein
MARLLAPLLLLPPARLWSRYADTASAAAATAQQPADMQLPQPFTAAYLLPGKVAAVAITAPAAAQSAEQPGAASEAVRVLVQ